jgi:hypothetical protein
MKYSRLSKYKIKKIIECFSEDITTTSAAKSQDNQQLYSYFKSQSVIHKRYAKWEKL